MAQLEKAKAKAGGYEETVTTTWKMSFQQVENASPASADLLRVLSLLAPDDVPHRIFEQSAAELGPHLAETLAEGGRRRGRGAALALLLLSLMAS